MNHSDAPRCTPGAPLPRGGTPTGTTSLATFLTDRLTEDLARIWKRGDPDGRELRAGMAAQVQIVDELLRVLAAGRLPVRAELRMMLLGYAQHPDFDPRWNEHLLD